MAAAEAEGPQDPVEQLDEQIADNPKDASLYRKRATIFFRAGEFGRALEDYSSALEFAPDAETYYNRGVAYTSAENPAMALGDYNQAIRRDPKFSAAYFNRGVLLHRLGKTVEAI